MKKIVWSILILFVCKASFAQKLWQINKDTVITWYYQDGDEFNDSELNTNQWKTWYEWACTIFSQ